MLFNYWSDRWVNRQQHMFFPVYIMEYWWGYFQTLANGAHEWIVGQNGESSSMVPEELLFGEKKKKSIIGN